MNILIIEDSANIASIYRTILTNIFERHNEARPIFRIVSNYKEWDAIKDEISFDIIFSDWMLDGDETAEYIILEAVKEYNVSPDNVVVISGFIYTEEDGTKHPSEMNVIAQDFGIKCFPKPVTSKQIVKILFGCKIMSK